MRAYRVAYDGRPYAGFQRQPHAKTVEGTLLAALADHDVLDPGDGPTHATPPGYAAAGRTDAGVSAVAQTVAFDAPTWLSPRAFNATLPDAIRVWAAADVPATFHATHDATARTYRYHLYAPVGGLPDDEPAIDEDLLVAAFDRLSGEHDFHNLTTDETGTVRDVRTTVTRSGDVLHVEVGADGFPRALVRRLVAAATRVARGVADSSLLDRLLEPEPVPGEYGVGPAPATPLVLWDVSYPGITFDVDETAALSARDAFGARHRDAGRAAAVTDALCARVANAADASRR
ncbi:tRNA pseudouridine(38-40) synthase TruA [Halorubrum sp. SY-15]|jgi:tRNA pseudouridine38-40 synthase|uniref:tRNA pseudouridine(38-40) synthase TruA n=1 Tax=Halorubrum sp. SY-15 TaxID=3402277 RepID=UPI003EB74161